MKRKLLFILLIIIAVMNLNSQTNSSLSLYLRLDKQLYCSNEQIILNICVKNNSAENAEFDYYDPANGVSNNYITFQPVVFDMSGREPELIVSYKQENKNIEDVLIYLKKRKIELAPDETYTFKVNLSEIYKFELDKKYRVKTFFIPQIENGSAIEGDNELNFSIKEFRLHSKKKDNNLTTRDITPSEVVVLHLNAEKNKDWDKYLKYIQVEKFIEAYPRYMGEYLRADSEDKSIVEKKFIKHLTGYRDDYLLDFKVTGEEIETNNIAYVDAVISRFGPRYDYRYKYRYTLEIANINGIIRWQIINLEATVIKGGKK